LAARLGERHPVLRLSAGGAARDLYDHVIESLHMQLRKIIKNRGHFPNDDAAIS